MYNVYYIFCCFWIVNKLLYIKNNKIYILVNICVYVKLIEIEISWNIFICLKYKLSK